MPTYKRPGLLPRAVDSVMRQTMGDWELVITDDEDPPGETWSHLQSLAADDPRIVIARNPGPHGQIGNNNFAMQQAQGTWIKPLFDDDALKPNCLEMMIDAISRAGGERVSLACCLADNFVNGQIAKAGRRGHAAPIERFTSDRALLACLRQEWEVGTPVQCIVHRRILDHDVLWEDPGKMHSAFDTWWLYRVMTLGDVVLVNEPLIDQHWGHETGTTAMQDNPALLDSDLRRLKHLLWSLPFMNDLDERELSITLRELDLIRMTLRLRDRRMVDALRLLARGGSSCTAWMRWWRWLKNKRSFGAARTIRPEPITTQDQ